MTAVVGAAVPVFHSPSSADCSTLHFSRNVAFYVSLSPFFSSSRLSASRKSGRRRRVVECREGSSFANKEIAHDWEELKGRQSASGRNAEFTRASVQEESSISRSRISSALPYDDGKCSRASHRQQDRGVKASGIHQSRGAKFSQFAHTSESYNRDDLEDDFIAPNGEEALRRRSRFVAKKHPKAPLPTQNQQTRLHNEATIFEGITEPCTLEFSGDNRTHQRSLRGNADDALSNIKEQGSWLDTERFEPSHTSQKGMMFMAKLEEELLALKKKDDFPSQSMKEAQRVDSASSMHAARGPQGLTKEGKGAQVNGVQMDSRGEEARPFDSGSPKGLQSDSGQARMLPKKSTGVEAGFTSFNLFSTPPSVPWEADRSYPSTFVPVNRNPRNSNRRLPTSIGSRSSPSQRSVTNRNNGHAKFGSQGTSGVDGAREVSRGGTQRNPRSDDIYVVGSKDDKVKTQVASWKAAERFKVPAGSDGKLESHAASDAKVAAEPSKRKEPMEPWASLTHVAFKSKNDKFRTEGVSRKGSTRNVEQVKSLFNWSESEEEEEVDNDLSTHVNAEKSMPSAFAMSPHNLQNHNDFDSEDDDTDVFELPFSDAEGNTYVSCVTNDVGMPNQSNFHGDVSLVFSGSEDDTSSPSHSDEMDDRNAHNMLQVNSNKGSSQHKRHISPVSEDWHKHDLSDLPFEFEFSYSETPQRPILGYRETPFSPFGPSYMKRPWIGGPPNRPSKKKPRVFDSFRPPPNHLKGVKAVQDPGPYPEGQGPKAAKSREEIIGEPLTKEEIIYLVEKCKHERRQLNIGRDGLTHNMLDLIHSYWKRRRVCKIKCKGVPTVDMDNVKFHIEDKTGGKIIYHTGGVLFLFRGRNYNYKDRPYIPLMLWKPTTPVYPKLIQPAPGGLTKEEAQGLRYLGRKVEPICRLVKNGVYATLVDEVRAAFKVDELVRVNCRGLNPSDYKKIGAKLRDLVPCVLLSFDKDHILMWKGKPESLAEGASSSQGPDLEAMPGNDSEARPDTCNDAVHSDLSTNEGDKQVLRPPIAQDPCEAGEVSISLASPSIFSLQKREEKIREEVDSLPLEVVSKVSELDGERGDDAIDNATSVELSDSIPTAAMSAEEVVSLEALASKHQVWDARDTLEGLPTNKGQADEVSGSQFEYAVDVDALWEHAFQSGMALELAEEDTDDDLVVRKADELAQSAPLAPRYTLNLVYKLQLKRDPDYKPKDELRIHFSRVMSQKPKKQGKRKFRLPTVGVPTMGGLPVDGLAKLLVNDQVPTYVVDRG